MNLYPYLKEEIQIFQDTNRNHESLDFSPIDLKDHWEDLGFVSYEHGLTALKGLIGSYQHNYISGTWPSGTSLEDTYRLEPESYIFNIPTALRLAKVSGTIRGKLVLDNMIKCLRLSYEMRRKIYWLKKGVLR